MKGHATFNLPRSSLHARRLYERGFAQFLIILAGAVIILIAVGFLAFKNRQSISSIPQRKSDSVQEIYPPTRVTPIIKPIKYSFTVEYPNDINTKQENRYLYITKLGPTQKTDTEIYDGIYLIFSEESLGDLTLLEYATQKVEASRKESIAIILKELEPITINNCHGYSYTAEGLGIYKYIYLASEDGQVVEIINGTIDPTNQDFQQTVDQILSTFQFIN